MNDTNDISDTISLLKLYKFYFVKKKAQNGLNETGCLSMLILRCDIVKILESLLTRPLDYLFIMGCHRVQGDWYLVVFVTSK